LVAELKAHDDLVLSAAFSPDSTRLVTGSWDNTARLWDVATGGEIAVLKGHTGTVNPTVFSPDGQRIVTASEDLTVGIWDASTGALLIQFRHSEFIRTVSFSTDGRHILAEDSAGNFLEWSVADGRLKRAFDGAPFGITHGIFGRDGALFVGDGDSGPAIAWEASTGHVIGMLPHEGTRGRVLGISPHGEMVAIGLNDGRLLLWKLSHALAPLEILTKGACARLGQDEKGRQFSEFEIASDPLIDEAWLRGDRTRQVCQRKAGL
jgi:WD40 repeat protein